MNIGIDLGGSHIGIGIVNENGKILGKMDTKINKGEIDNIEEYIIENIIKNIYELLRINKLELSDIEFIGIGAPGEPSNGTIKRMVNLGIENFNIVRMLKEKLNFENIGIRNDGKCAGIAEKLYGSMKEYDDTVFLCIGSGIGGAAFIGNKLFSPKRYSGFEVGHMIIKMDGNMCKCGNKGCFETYCSIKYFGEKLISKMNIDNVAATDLLNYLLHNQDNEEIINLIDEYINDMVIGLNNIVNLMEPEEITLGGGFVYFKEIFWKKLQDKFYKAEGLYNKENIPVLKLATLGNDAGIIGASIDRTKK